MNNKNNPWLDNQELDWVERNAWVKEELTKAGI